MKFLVLAAEFPPGPGGLGTHAHQVATGLVRLGWEGAVAADQDHMSDAEIEAFNRQQPFPVRRFARRGGLLGSAAEKWRAADAFIRQERPDLLFPSGDRMNYLTALLARRHRLPWIATEHGRVPPGVERRIKIWAYQDASAVVCVSDYTHEQMTGMGVRPRLSRVVPNGADPSRFRVLPPDEAARHRAALPAGARRVLLTVGSVTERKGQDVVVRALPRILEREPETHYLCAGIPARGEALTALARELGVERHVHVLGRTDEATLLGLMNGCDLFVMTSRHTGEEWEGYGIAAVEAALCGKPAVVTARSGLAEAIEDGRTGLTVPQDDPAATAEAVLALLGDEARRLRMGAAARERALGEQTWEQRLRQYDALLREVLVTRKGRKGSAPPERSGAAPGERPAGAGR